MPFTIEIPANYRSATERANRALQLLGGVVIATEEDLHPSIIG